MQVALNNRLKKVTALVFASGGFVGFFPFASGTWGSLVGVAMLWLTRDTGLVFQALMIVALFIIGVWASGVTVKMLNQPDSSRIVIDEIVGMAITMYALPLTPYSLALGFFIFRFLDVLKPTPADWADSRLKGGLGVMADDVIAGIYGNLWMHFVLKTSF